VGEGHDQNIYTNMYTRRANEREKDRLARPHGTCFTVASACRSGYTVSKFIGHGYSRTEGSQGANCLTNFDLLEESYFSAHMRNPVPRVADHHVLCFSHASLGALPRSANPLLAALCNLRKCPLRLSTTAPLSSPSERERETASARARTRAWFSWET
jgi:hypothetical protein